jgi:hypothetical protein
MLLRLLAIVPLSFVVACGGASPAERNPAAPAAAGPNLRTTLAPGCFGWPGTEFSPSNSASVRAFLAAGEVAVEFTLRDVEGTAVSLSGLLASRPVLLVHGAFT